MEILGWAVAWSVQTPRLERGVRTLDQVNARKRVLVLSLLLLLPSVERHNGRVVGIRSGSRFDVRMTENRGRFTPITTQNLTCDLWTLITWRRSLGNERRQRERYRAHGQPLYRATSPPIRLLAVETFSCVGLFRKQRLVADFDNRLSYAFCLYRVCRVWFSRENVTITVARCARPPVPVSAKRTALAILFAYKTALFFVFRA